MDTVYTREITTTYTIQALVNDSDMTFAGSGYGRADEGKAGVDIQAPCAYQCPDGFQPALMAFTLITGMADIGRRLQDIKNPFQLTRGAYQAIRTLTLDNDRGQLSAKYEFDAANDDGFRAARFNIEGCTNVPTIRAIRPAFETWVPNSQGKIRGHFTMVWVTVDGQHIKGEVDTDYRIEGVSIDEPIYRKIDFVLDTSDRHLRQAETIVVFNEEALGRLAA